MFGDNLDVFSEIHNDPCSRDICRRGCPVLNLASPVNCEAQGKGRAGGRPRKVTQRSFIDGGWLMVDGGYPFPDALH